MHHGIFLGNDVGAANEENNASEISKVLILITFCFHYNNNKKTAIKTILNGLNGEFRAGELTAIMGHSGSGKSTLLDILTGYITKLTSGTITANGCQCEDLKIAYIIQDCQLQIHITVSEAMFFSMNLKVGAQLNYAEKKERVCIKICSAKLKQNKHCVLNRANNNYYH